MAEPCVGLLRRAEPGVLPHGPELAAVHRGMDAAGEGKRTRSTQVARGITAPVRRPVRARPPTHAGTPSVADRKSTRLNSSHGYISYAVFCLKKKKRREYSRRCSQSLLPSQPICPGRRT